MLQLAASIIHLNVTYFSAFEQIARRVVQVEMAFSKNPYQPNFSGFGVVFEGGIAAGDSSRESKLRPRFVVGHADKAIVLKHHSLWSEETRSDKKPKRKFRDRVENENKHGEEYE